MAKMKIRLGSTVNTKDGKITVKLIATEQAAKTFGISPCYKVSDLRDNKGEEEFEVDTLSKASDGDTVVWGN